jgi:hypothetical protein
LEAVQDFDFAILVSTNHTTLILRISDFGRIEGLPPRSFTKKLGWLYIITTQSVYYEHLRARIRGKSLKPYQKLDGG